jgi:hypothetical protein
LERHKGCFLKGFRNTFVEFNKTYWLGQKPFFEADVNLVCLIFC